MHTHVTACLYVHRVYCVPARMYFHVMKGKNHAQIQTICKILIIFLDQKLTFFRMVYLVFLQGQSYMLKMQVEFKHSFGE